MADFGMQMPGGRGRMGPTPNVYTALMFVAVVALIGACAAAYLAATKVSPDTGNPFSVQAENPRDVRIAG